MFSISARNSFAGSHSQVLLHILSCDSSATTPSTSRRRSSARATSRSRSSAISEGNCVHVFERDCSIQRRNQKVVEETPSPAAPPDLVQRMGAIAVQGAKAVGYFSAGTFEFLLAPDGSFYFLEMNTRLQVEHPITELVSGLDLVREMVHVAQGEKLQFAQNDITRRGAAIECRIYAEDPASGFLPSPGTIGELEVPAGPGIRDDGGAYAGCTISSFYDPLISKLCAWAPTRERALARMRRALEEYVVTGIRTNIAFHQKLLEHPEFAAGHYDTGFLERHKDVLLGYGNVPDDQRTALAVAVAIAASRMERAIGARHRRDERVAHAPVPVGRDPPRETAPLDLISAAVARVGRRSRCPSPSGPRVGAEADRAGTSRERT